MGNPNANGSSKTNGIKNEAEDGTDVAEPREAPVDANSTVLGDLAQYVLTPGEDIADAESVVQIVARRPVGDEWVRASAAPQHSVDVILLESSRDNTTYLVMKALKDVVRAPFKAKRLTLCANRFGDLLLWPVSIPSSRASATGWVTSANRAVELAKTKWVRAASNMRLGAYDIAVRRTVPGDEPTWPTMTTAELLASAYAGKIIATADHPVLVDLRGED